MVESEKVSVSLSYKLDVSEIEDIEDVKEVLKALDLRVSENYEHFETLKPYLKEE